MLSSLALYKTYPLRGCTDEWERFVVHGRKIIFGGRVASTSKRSTFVATEFLHQV